ncbi:retrovirus-related pol polyprotein from transposon TNT 1-94, partial [Tanacetum coccineum]
MPYLPCTHCGFNDHRPDDCRNYHGCEICGNYDVFTLEHNRVIQIRGGVLDDSSQSSESSIRRHIRETIWYTDSGCSRSMNGVKSYLHKYVEQPGPKEIVLISPRRNDVYVLNMSSLTPSGACFFAKSSESVNWLWHKRLSHLNFKSINKLAKQNKVLCLPSLVYSKDKPCSTHEKGKHKRASFKTKQNFAIRKCLHLLYMDLFGLVSPMSINHEKFTLVIVDEYSRMVENQNDVKVKQIRTDNEIKLNKTLTEAARNMLNGSVLSKHFWTETVRISCYTQNISIIVKRLDRTPYEIFRERIPDISYFYVFGRLMFIHNHKDHLGKFDAKADDGYFLRYSFNSKAFRVFNIRRQQMEETYHVTFDESFNDVRFINTSVDEIGIDDSSRYPPDEFIQEDDPSRQYQTNSNISYYIISYSRSLTQENHVPEVIAPNEQDTPHIKDVEGPRDPPNTEDTQELNF